jgi:hypothetical protein
MKFKNCLGHQGDTQWYKIDEIPANAKKVQKRFLAQSERTGSMHALFGDYDLYELEDGFVIDAKEECILNHSLQQELLKMGVSLDKPDVLPPKDHRHSVIPQGMYFVGIQNRFDPMENLKQRVKD